MGLLLGIHKIVRGKQASSIKSASVYHKTPMTVSISSLYINCTVHIQLCIDALFMCTTNTTHYIIRIHVLIFRYPKAF